MKNPLPPLSAIAGWVAGLAMLAPAAAATESPTASDASRPNIIFILADDLGWGELGSYGQRVIRTPHLDRLAAEGMRFTQFYAGSTVCAPSRSVLLTGRHQGRTRVRGNSPDPIKLALLEEDLTFAEPLREAGYRTGYIGKWGLGDRGVAATGLPNRQGFDFFFGFLNHWHAHNHFPDHLWRNEARVDLPNRARLVGDYGGSVTDDPVLFADDLFAEEALSWIARDQSSPFLLVWSPVIPHANNERTITKGNGAQVPDFGPYASEDWPDADKGHAAMISRLDAYVGRLRQRLEELGMAENTLVFFTSDNGPHNESRHNLSRFQPSGPFTGIKRDLTEGGIRVPGIAWWPGRIAAGTLTEHVAYFGDWFATVCELAQVPCPPDLDSISFVPALEQRLSDQPRHRFLYWENLFQGQAVQAVLHDGRWKAHRRLHHDAPLVLYDLRADPAETRDLAADHPEIVRVIEDWLKTAPTPADNWPLFTLPSP